MVTLLIFLAVLSVLVLIHEFGHFAAAKLLGIKVEEFALGLPYTKPIFSWKHGEVSYAVYPLLFGGFVRMHGEEADVTVDRSRAFWNKGKKARVIVIVAGVVMNVVLALVAFGVLYLNLGIPTGTREKVTVVRLVEGSPAVSAGLMVKDRVLEVEGKPVGTGKEFSALMKSWAGLPVQLVIERGDTLPLFEGIAERNVERIFITVVPRVNPPAGEGPLGVAILDYPYLSVRSCSGQNAGCVLGVVPAAVKTVGIWAVRVVDGLREIGKSLLAAKTPEGVSGPIGIYKLTGLVAGEGFLPLVELVAVLSINLAVFNVLPIPALDGGRLFMVLLEWVRRKRVPADLEQKINSWGMVFLLGLVLLISLQDVMNLESVKKLLGR